MDWEKFKTKTERWWRNSRVHPNVWGYQIVAGTQWNAGMTEAEIERFERQLGFPFPFDYRDFLRCINGFDRECIDVRGDPQLPPRHSRQCYKYPDDLPNVAWLLADTVEYRQTIDDVLEGDGFSPDDVLGFIPIYAHRALVVFGDRKLSPVLSMVGNDVIIYGRDLADYISHEFIRDQ
ncbi:hypothetical protein QFZ83_004253 [Variovorax sp. W1I1]|uniref:SMI1/KNR4 family protein n=1 Tax=Variovorax sp. W1I1 TaxID=3042309 RepID=UPI002781D853|nr:SMI1/KNR4 family protein [Variovorax sp. W1I1]MDQ0610082.1 hypothetical protein [Variovorax sp. W1I1]